MILAVNRILPARPLSHIFTAAVLLFAYLDSSFAIETLRIEAILASPRFYAQHDVTLYGKVRQIRKVEPYACSKTICGSATVAYSFIFEGDTAAIEIVVPFSCVGEAPLDDGQRISATVNIRALERDGFQLTVIGVAPRIRASEP
jgi:hypothetical protein